MIHRPVLRPLAERKTELVACLLVLIGVSPAWAQLGSTDPSAFTFDDSLNVVSARVVDLTKDGRWAVVTMSDGRGRLGADNSRYGDPTYISPSLADVFIVDTKTGEKHRLFPGKRQVSGLRWSPDGTRLSLMLRRGDAFAPMIWEMGKGFTEVEVPEGMQVDARGSGAWTPDDP